MIKQNQKLIPTIIQDSYSKEILMLGYMNTEAINKTLEGPDVWFYSRSRKTLWHKGETSGNYLKFISMHADCDQDSLLVLAEPTGPSCHKGETSCFKDSKNKLENRLELMKENLKGNDNPGTEIIEELFSVIRERHQNPKSNSYTSHLFKEGPEKISKKLIEEAGEIIIEFLDANKKNSQLLVNEICDLLFHLLVLVESADLELTEIYSELSKRRFPKN